MFPSQEIIEKIKKFTDEDMPIAELEYLGLSLRVINSLEESKYKIVYLKNLISLGEEKLKNISNLGSSGLKQILNVLNRLEQLEIEKKKWHGEY